MGVPVHLVGHSFGGTVAIAVALRELVPLASLTVLEAPIIELLREHGEAAHDAAVQDMTSGYFAAFGSGDRAAIGRMVDFYGGAGSAVMDNAAHFMISTHPGPTTRLIDAHVREVLTRS